MMSIVLKKRLIKKQKGHADMNFLWTIVCKLAWMGLSLRYKIEVKGLDQLKKFSFSSSSGILFMPNHPAHMDPVMIFTLLWPKFRMRPIVTEYIYRLGILKPFMKTTKGIPIPSFTTSVNQFKIKKAKQALAELSEGLKNKENFIIYPSGRLKHSGEEVVGGSSGAHEIIQECPNANVVLIRTSGLWGSSFSRAILGVSPDLPKTILQGIKTLLKNGIFFSPRRKISIEIVVQPETLPRTGTRLEFNRYLESFYNQYPDGSGNIVSQEPLQLVSYAFWKNQLPTILNHEKQQTRKQAVKISEETQEKVFKEIRKILGNPKLQIHSNQQLTTDLGMDSLNVAETIAFLAQKFDAEDVHPEDIETVKDLLEIAEVAKNTPKTKKVSGLYSFPEEVGRNDPLPPTGDTLAEAFLQSCDRMKDFIACGDDMSGIITYKKLKKSALVLAKHFQKIPQTHVAVLLPASLGAYLVIFALQLANKVPVMLNWTLGPRYLEEMLRISGSDKVITSWKFLERLSHVDFGDIIDKVELLEDIRTSLSLKTKLSGVLLSMMPSKRVLKSLNLQNKDKKDPAVILFTSGTEALPKAVPLSHDNILSNQRSLLTAVKLLSSDCFYSILPPFHSFGFSVAGTLPILSGIKAAYFPDPTDSFALAEGIKRWKISLFCAAPNFLKGLFFAAKPHELDTIRLFISGAEKASNDLFTFISKLKNKPQLVEGYGITECSPVLTVTPLDLPPKGVGKLIPGIEACTIHVETEQKLPKGSEGEICVRGPNVFYGYLGNPRAPFIEIDGLQWYRTGDIGYFDADGFLILSGRLKRFTKLGGEMISLGAIEDTLCQELFSKGIKPKEGPLLAVLARELPNQKPEIIVFATCDLNREIANDLLIQAGFSRLVKISYVYQIEEIPLLGTGKTNYRQLQTQITHEAPSI